MHAWLIYFTREVVLPLSLSRIVFFVLFVDEVAPALLTFLAILLHLSLLVGRGSDCFGLDRSSSLAVS